MAPSITDIPDVSESASNLPKYPSAGPINISLIGAAAFAKAVTIASTHVQFTFSFSLHLLSEQHATKACSSIFTVPHA